MLLRFSLTLKATSSPAKRTLATKSPGGYPATAKSSGTLHPGRTTELGNPAAPKSPADSGQREETTGHVRSLGFK